MRKQSKCANNRCVSRLSRSQPLTLNRMRANTANAATASKSK